MAVVLEQETSSYAEYPGRKLWTREELHRLESIGLIDLHNCELIDGVLIRKVGKNRGHTNSLMLLVIWLRSVFEPTQVQHEASIDMLPEDDPTNEPEPDAVVTTRPLTVFRETNPGPQDIALLVEVAETTLRFDLGAKARLYARSRIPEYWVLDVSDRRLIVHRNPEQGRYTTVVAYGAEESVAPLAAPQHSVLVSSLFL
ncbi:MAG: Uma2 family endonuclease [Bryobacteraceae bacterium]